MTVRGRDLIEKVKTEPGLEGWMEKSRECFMWV